MTLEQVHTATWLVAVLLLTALAVRARAVLAGLRAFFVEPGTAAALGGLRAFIFWKIFWSAAPGSTATYAELPASLRTYPYGWETIGPYLPYDPNLAAVVEMVFFVVCALAMVGLFTRVAVPLAALLSIYVLGLPNFYLKINHDSHALTMIALILAVSPCGDGFSLDRLRMRRKGHAAPPLASQYTAPIRMSWLVLGTAYLFPGVWKLWTSGDRWLSGRQLKAELYAKWSQLVDFEPLIRIDESQLLLAAVGTATVVFEIGFMFALFNGYTRVLAAFSGVAFHFGIWQLMSIRFHIALPLILLFDSPGLPDLVRKHAPALAARVAPLGSTLSQVVQRLWTLPSPSTPTPPRRSALPAYAVGGVLFSAQMAAGLAEVHSWPVTIFPAFSKARTQETGSARRLQLLLEPASGGEPQDLTSTLQHLGKARVVKLMRRLRSMRHHRELEREGAMIVGLFRSAGVAVAPGDRITMYEERWDLFPLGERANFRRKAKASYEVTAAGSLVNARKR